MAFACANCGDREAVFASIETVIGTCDGKVLAGRDGELLFEPGGYTDVDWGTAETCGYRCQSCLYQVMAVPVGLSGQLDVASALAALVEVTDE